LRLLIQRVSEASVEVENKVIGRIGQGLLVFVGIESADNIEDIKWLTKKLLNLRIFADEKGMNLSVNDINGSVLVVSQFTLHASIKKGNRPSFIKAAPPGLALQLYEEFIEHLRNESNLKIETGKFGAMMNVKLLNSGPVTIFIDSKNKQ
jgi:D-tyrosyl-tRNA(Tyr) deacylase